MRSGGLESLSTVRQTWAQIARIARAKAEAIELGRALDDSEIVLLDEWHAGTYGIPNEKTIDAIRLCARLEGVLTDPVYEGKSIVCADRPRQLGADRAELARALRASGRPAGAERLRRRVLIVAHDAGDCSGRVAPLLECVEDEGEAVLERLCEVVTDLGDVFGDDLGEVRELLLQLSQLPSVLLRDRGALFGALERDALLLQGEAVDVGVLN